MVEPGTVIALLGNKVDDASGCPDRQVKEKDGSSLAKVSNTCLIINPSHTL